MFNWTQTHLLWKWETIDMWNQWFESNCKSITIRLTFSDLHGEVVIALTNSQVDRLVEARAEKKGMTIKM